LVTYPDAVMVKAVVPFGGSGDAGALRCDGHRHRHGRRSGQKVDRWALGGKCSSRRYLVKRYAGSHTQLSSSREARAGGRRVHVSAFRNEGGKERGVKQTKGDEGRSTRGLLECMHGLRTAKGSKTARTGCFPGSAKASPIFASAATSHPSYAAGPFSPAPAKGLATRVEKGLAAGPPVAARRSRSKGRAGSEGGSGRKVKY